MHDEVDEAHNTIFGELQSCTARMLGKQRTKIYETRLRYYYRIASGTLLGLGNYFFALHSAHIHIQQGALVTVANAVDGIGKTWGHAEYDRWCATVQFGRASEEDILRGSTDDKWYRGPVKEIPWFVASTASDYLTNWLAFQDPVMAWHFTAPKAVGRLTLSLSNEFGWKGIPWGKERIPADEFRAPHPPLYKDLWALAKSLYKRVTRKTAPSYDPEPLEPISELRYLPADVEPSG